MEEINFFAEDISFSLDDPNTIADWIKQIVSVEKHQTGAINFIFCSDNYLHNLNVSYLNHDTLTDIITFDTTESGEPLEADIFISIERVTDNAKDLDKPFLLELNRVIIHGVLHLLGYQDKSDDQKKEMRKKEEACLSLLNQV